MKVPAIILVALTCVAAADAATVVLKGGKHIEAATYVQKGNYVLVQYANGRAESYPLTAVDLVATREANAVKVDPPPVAKPTGPHSPFVDAVATAGETAARVSDEDVQHIAPAEEGEEAGEEEQQSGAGQVVLLGYDKQLVGENQWAITATISNTGADPVRNINANVKLLDDKGTTIGSGTATFPGTLEAGKQGMISATVVATGDARQIAFEFQWQTIKVAPRPAGAGAAGGTAPAEGASVPGQADEAPGWDVAPGASPNAMPSNPMAVPPLTEPPIAPQVQRGTGAGA